MDTTEPVNNFLKRLDTTPSLDDKQLPENLSRQLNTIVSHFQNKAGNIVLFSSASTPKNEFAAGLLGKLVNRDIYCVDLSAVASQHIGETEKKLLQIFDFSEQNHFILFFDEADSLFSKRTKAHSDNDRFANLDINYLLKRMQAYPELVIFTTNARDNLDDTLLRTARWQLDLDHHAEKPLPLWQRIFNS